MHHRCGDDERVGEFQGGVSGTQPGGRSSDVDVGGQDTYRYGSECRLEASGCLAAGLGGTDEALGEGGDGKRQPLS